jgi:hypothetical protein
MRFPLPANSGRSGTFYSPTAAAIAQGNAAAQNEAIRREPVRLPRCELAIQFRDIRHLEYLTSMHKLCFRQQQSR